MALQPCKECSRELSTFLPSCPYCKVPIDSDDNKIECNAPILTFKQIILANLAGAGLGFIITITVVILIEYYK